VGITGNKEAMQLERIIYLSTILRI